MLLVSTSINAHAQRTPLPIPDKTTYSEFLVNPWQANKPSLITFKDPRCPHCAKAIKKIDRLDNYNVFVFWAPILGDRSKQIVDQIFSCQTLTSDEVFKAVIRRNAPQCNSVMNEARRKLNDDIVASYNPRSVPQYWLGGSRVQVARLNLAETKEQRIASIKENTSLQIPWKRYADMSVTPDKRGLYRAALVLPASKSINDFFKTAMYTDNTFKWHVVESNKNSKSTEFMLLTNLIEVTKPTVIIEGKVLTENEMNSLLSESFLQNFAAL
jgi:glutaredoxin